MKYYLDTCVVSGIAKEDLAIEERSALSQLLKEDIEIYTSSVTKMELEKIPAEYRKRHIDIYQQIEQVNVVDYLMLNLRPGRIGLPVQRKKGFDKLYELLADRADAQHLFQCAENGVTNFITVDARTILNKAAEIKAACGVFVQKPSSALKYFEKHKA